MNDFRRLTPQFWVSPQIDTADVAHAAASGFALIVNNRPDGESPEEPQGAEIRQAAQNAGLGYAAIPIGHAGFSDAQVRALADVMAQADGPLLAYCRSGTRSTLLWALAAARAGEDPAQIAACARSAGYDISPIGEMIAIYAQSADKS